jgi:hypothetical protein
MSQMLTVFRLDVRALFSMLAVSCILVLPMSAVKGEEQYVGKWWLTTNKYQRLRFVDGYTTCYHYMVDPKRPFQENIKLYVERMNAYLQEHPRSSDEPVDALLWRVANPPYSKSPVEQAPGGEEWKEKWGYHDGDNDWLLMDDSVRLAFLQGFLECYDKRTNHPDGTFSKSREWYVKAINDWYGYTPNDPSATINSRAADKIPEVLFRFSDEAIRKSK